MSRPKKGRKPSAEEKRARLVKAARKKAEEALTAIKDPATPSEEVARLLSDLHPHSPIPATIIEYLELQDPVRATEVVSHLVDQADDPSMALGVRAQLAMIRGDHVGALALLEPSLEGHNYPTYNLSLTLDAMQHLGRVADAIALIRRVVDLSGMFVEQEWLIDLLAVAGYRLADDPKDCICDRNKRFARCCGPRLREHLDDFHDQRLLTDLIGAMRKFWNGYHQNARRLEEAETWGLPAWPSPGHDKVPFGFQLAEQRAWVMDDDDDESTATEPLARYAALPSTGKNHRRLAEAWTESGRSGLYLLSHADDDDRESPLALHSLIDGAFVTAHLDPVVAETIPTWSVLMGTLVPDRGFWRLLPDFVILTPDEGDRITALLEADTSTMLADLRGRHARPVKPKVQPFGYLATMYDEVDSDFSLLAGKVCLAQFPVYCAVVAETRTRPVGLTNTDREPLVFLTARFERVDAEGFAKLAENSPDLETVDDEIVWWGKPLTEQQIRQQAVFIAEEIEKGNLDPDAEPAQDPRWLRGRVRWEGGTLVLEVNSRERLDAFVGILGDLAPAPPLVEEAETPTPPPPPLVPGFSSQEAADVWSRDFPDTPMPSLEGLTVRQAYLTDRYRPEVETMLRRFEWEGWHLRHNDLPSPDIESIRESLYDSLRAAREAEKA